MPKPINRFAVAIWVAAATIVAYEIVLLSLVIPPTWNTARIVSGYWMTLNFALGQIRDAMVPALLLAAFGYCIETLDQIRWNTRQRQS